MRFLILMLAFVMTGLSTPPALAETSAWNGLWFECEYSGRQAPPADDCAMLDDDGFFFEEGQVTYMKVMDSPETDQCKKQRAGQCVRADEAAITVKASRRGKAVFSETTIGMRFLACTQIFHMYPVNGYYEARPDEDRCIWAGEKYFYLRKYDGQVTVED